MKSNFSKLALWSLIFCQIIYFLPLSSLAQQSSIKIDSLSELSEAISSYVEPFVSNRDFEGYVLIQQKGQKLISKSFSKGNAEFSDTTPFMLASISKTFTAEIIGSLIQKGKIHESSKLEEFIPDYPHAEKISIRHLLTHASGIPDYYSILEFQQIKMEEMPPEKFIKWISQFSLEFKPGKKNSYSNSGYNFLAYLSESVTSKSFNENLQKLITIPLDMKSTYSIRGIYPEDLPEHFEPGHGPEMLRKARNIDPSWLIGSGSIISTAQDLLKWSSHILSLLAPPRQWKAFGWGVRKHQSQLYLEQNGRVPGFASHIRLHPESQSIIILLSRIESDAVNYLASGISDIIHGINPPITEQRKLQALSPEAMSQYEGIYEISPDFLFR